MFVAGGVGMAVAALGGEELQGRWLELVVGWLSGDLSVGAGDATHKAQRHWSCWSYLWRLGLTVVKYSEKKRSPLSFGRVSAFGKGMVTPQSFAMALMYCNSLWLEYGTIFSQPAGILLLSSMDVPLAVATRDLL